jgi:hypothetical protein
MWCHLHLGLSLRRPGAPAVRSGGGGKTVIWEIHVTPKRSRNEIEVKSVWLPPLPHSLSNFSWLSMYNMNNIYIYIYAHIVVSILLQVRIPVNADLCLHQALTLAHRQYLHLAHHQRCQLPCTLIPMAMCSGAHYTQSGWKTQAPQKWLAVVYTQSTEGKQIQSVS